MDNQLTNKQQAFIEHYCGDCTFNGTEAASRAGYKGSRGLLAVVATENLRKPKIKAAILVKTTETGRKIDVDVQEIVIELRSLAFNPVMGLLSIDTGNRLRALELLGRYKAMFTDKVQDVTEQQRELSESEKAEAKRIANIRLKEA